MAANTGPNLNTYQIPEVELSDTFNVWRDTTNTQTFKLNKLKVYDGVSSSSITLNLSGGGTFQAELADNVGKGVTFAQPVVFSNGVTFNGDVTFNAQTFTVNANVVTIDDYAIVLGATSSASDNNINTAGGGGVLISRGAGSTAEWLWRAASVQGLTGIWSANAHIGFSGASAGLYPHNGNVLPVHGTGLRLDGNANGAHGLQVDLTNGTGVNSTIALSRYSPAGSTVFAEVLNGATYGSRPFLNVKDGANRKTITVPTAQTWGVGTPLRFNGTTYVAAIASGADSAEVVGVVSSVINSTTFEITFIGEIFGNFRSATENGGDLVAGQTYYLSTTQSGKLVGVAPTSAGSVHKAVLIATGVNSAIVIPFTGGLLTSTLTLSTSTSVAKRISQINQFKIGDVVRFASNPNGTTLTYTISNQTVQRYYAHGSYVRADASSVNTGQVAGMVVARDSIRAGTNYLNGTNLNDAVWEEFDVLMDGWFDGLVTTPPLVPGTEYYLRSNHGGNGPCLEGSTPNFIDQAPTTSNHVEKKLFLATSPTSGYLYSYRGDPVRSTTNTFVELQNSLIKDLRSDIYNDLSIGVYANSGAAGGRSSIIITPAPDASGFTGSGSREGNVGIGLSSWTRYNNAADGDRILGALDVAGWMRVGRTFSSGTSPIPGQDLLVVRHYPDKKSSGPTAEARIVVGSDHTDGNLVLGYKVRPNPSNRHGYYASITGQHSRSALVIGASGDDPTLIWKIRNDNASVPNLTTSVPMTDLFIIQNTSMLYDNFLFLDGVRNAVGIGTATPGASLDVLGKVSSMPTVSGDTATTLTTKGYVDSRSSTIKNLAFVNFNGRAKFDGNGANESSLSFTDRFIRVSNNVSKVVRTTEPGYYVVHFVNELPTSYCVSGSACESTGAATSNGAAIWTSPSMMTGTTCGIRVANIDGTGLVDGDLITVLFTGV